MEEQGQRTYVLGHGSDEHRRLIELTVEVARGRVPVLAGCGSNNTAHAIELTLAAKEVGADAVLHVPPYYNRPNQDGIFLHLSKVADCGIPVVLYNVPARTITDIAVDTMGRLSRLPNVIGVKASGLNNTAVGGTSPAPTYQEVLTKVCLRWAEAFPKRAAPDSTGAPK